MKNKKKIIDESNSESNGEDLFDECPICQAMKAAKEKDRELTETELKEAFKKAKDQGGAVGGEWFKNG